MLPLSLTSSKAIDRLYRALQLCWPLTPNVERCGRRRASILPKRYSKRSKRSAHREAIGLYERTLKALQRLPSDRSAKLAIDVRLKAFFPLLALGEVDRLVESHETGR